MTRPSARRHGIWAAHDRGATAVEYSLMVAVLAMAVLGAVSLLGTSLADFFQGFADTIADAIN